MSVIFRSAFAYTRGFVLTLGAVLPLGLSPSAFAAEKQDSAVQDGAAKDGAAQDGELRPFDASRIAELDIFDAFTRAKQRDTRVLLVMGGNWCHDSRALATRFATPEFATLIADNFELVYVDVGEKDRNLDIATRYGLDGIAGTPTVLALTANGIALNLKTAPTWRNAADRSAQETLSYFTALAVRENVESE